MIWTESAGGPLVAMTATDVQLWSGTESDYDRACSIEFVGMLAIAPGIEAVVIGDEPAGTTFVSAWNSLVQWLYAEPETNVYSILRSSLEGAAWELGPAFESQGPFVLFDAAISGSEVVIHEVDDLGREPTVYERTDLAIRCDLAPGKYVIQSADVAPNERTCFRVHRFVSATP